MNDQLKAPFPYFGGKTLAAEAIWELLGDCQNYIEPFAGSIATLLARPSPVKGPETINDYSAHVVNFWRAMQADPEGLALACIGPVSEVNTEAEHYAIVYGEPTLRDSLGDPHFYNMEFAAWWVCGACEWIGSGWATEGRGGPWYWTRGAGWRKLPHLGDAGTGVSRKLPHLGNGGTGVSRQLPHLGNGGKGEYSLRVEWLVGWFSALRDRLSGVRIACGDFERVLGPSVTTKHTGVTGVFLDPPYESTEYVYGSSVSVSSRVRDWCIANSLDPKLRIVLAGRGAEHDDLIILGWSRTSWKARGGYSGKPCDEEVLWASPSCNG